MGLLSFYPSGSGSVAGGPERGYSAQVMLLPPPSALLLKAGKGGG